MQAALLWTCAQRCQPYKGSAMEAMNPVYEERCCGSSFLLLPCKAQRQMGRKNQNAARKRPDMWTSLAQPAAPAAQAVHIMRTKHTMNMSFSSRSGMNLEDEASAPELPRGKDIAAPQAGADTSHVACASDFK